MHGGLGAQVRVTPRFHFEPESSVVVCAGRATAVYALGLVLYQWLAGHHPFAPPGSPPLSPEALLFARIANPAPPALPAVPTVVRNLLEGALAEEPEARFRDASVFATAVRAARAALPEAAADPAPPLGPSATDAGRASPTEEPAGRSGAGPAWSPTDVLAAAPRRLPELLPATVAADPPSELASRSDQHGVASKSAAGRGTVVVGIAGLGVGAASRSAPSAPVDASAAGARAVDASTHSRDRRIRPDGRLASAACTRARRCCIAHAFAMVAAGAGSRIPPASHLCADVEEAAARPNDGACVATTTRLRTELAGRGLRVPRECE